MMTRARDDLSRTLGVNPPARISRDVSPERGGVRAGERPSVVHVGFGRRRRAAFPAGRACCAIAAFSIAPCGARWCR